MFVRFAMVCAVALALPVSAWADPLLFKRTGKWIVDYDKDACHLFAEFGDGALLARFSRYGPTDNFDLRLFGEAVRTTRFDDVTVDFGIGAKSTHYGLGAMAGKTPALILNGIRVDGLQTLKPGEAAPPISPAVEARVIGMTIGMDSKRELRLEFGSLGRPLQQMRDCMDGMVKRWGYDPAIHATLTRKATPAGDPRRWISDKDYPKDPLTKGQSGVVSFRLDIDPDGAVAGCYVLEHTENDAFSKYTCDLLMKRARFNPALDAQGKPIRTFFVSKVSWLIPR